MTYYHLNEDSRRRREGSSEHVAAGKRQITESGLGRRRRRRRRRRIQGLSCMNSRVDSRQEKPFFIASNYVRITMDLLRMPGTNITFCSMGN